MKIDFSMFTDGLVPAIIQDFHTQKVLMLGFMNEVAYRKTEETGIVTFFSRSKQHLWTKGEQGGSFLHLRQILLDCDKDTLLVKVEPKGPVCQSGADTCWSEKNHRDDFLYYLDHLVHLRLRGVDGTSYVKKMYDEGTATISGKIEQAASALTRASADVNQSLFLNEAAGLLFHYLILLHAKDCSLNDVVKVLEQRHQSK